jgi:hypothetical protein
MNTMKKVFGKGAVLLAAGILAAVLEPSAFSQVTPTTIVTLANFPVSMPGNLASSNMWSIGGTNQPTNNIIQLRQGQGVGVQFSFQGNASSTDTFYVDFADSLDGTNFTTTTNQYQISAAANGTNQVTVSTNFIASLLNNKLDVTPVNITCSGVQTNGISNIVVTVGLGNIVPGGYGGY